MLLCRPRQGLVHIGRVAGALMALIALVCVGCAAAPPPGRDYCFSPSGSDEAGDGSALHPWQSIFKANTLALHPGDRVLFEGGQTFLGNLRLEQSAAGLPQKPVVVSSYGAGRATIDAGDDIGVCVHNAGNIRVSNLVVYGSGRGRNWGAGVAFFNTLVGSRKLENVSIEDVDVSGFQFEGILVRGMSDDGSRGGYRHVRIVRCKSHQNLHTGIYVTGWWKPGADDYANEDVYIAQCDASENTGDPAAPWENRSGSGIFVEATDGAVIEHCLASGNGTLCRGNTGGPVGIWTSIAQNVTIQRNKSVGNRSGGRFDGGGFCLDGGVVNSVVQYNVSQDNDGSGYGVFAFEGSPLTAHNIIRGNKSVDDGRRNGYAGIHLWSAGAGVKDIEIALNDVHMSGADLISPRAIWIQAGASDVRVHDNRIVATAGAKAVEVSAGQTGVRFHGDTYQTEGSGDVVDWEGKRFTAGAAWEGLTEK